LYALIAVSLVAISVLAVYSFHNQPNSNNTPKAAIIDQLSSLEEFTNTTFVTTATNILTAAGYQVTYYAGSDVNVDFYQNLPTDGYQILIFRVHSALRLSYTGNLTAPLDFFTSEPYSPQAHVQMQELGQLDRVMYNETSTTQYWGISPTFVMGAMEGNFHNATIILEGCNGLDGQARSETMLQALIYKGAKVVIGWNASVSESHTDIATEDLLNRLLLENETVKEAVNMTNQGIGLDPAYSNKLLYYLSKGPPFYCGVDVGNYTIPHDSSTSATTDTNANNALSLTRQSFLAIPLLSSVKEFLVLAVP
jgi:hypothetical protein